LVKTLVHYDDQFRSALWRHENRNVAELRDIAIRRNIDLDQSKYYDVFTIAEKIAERGAGEAMSTFDARMQAQDDQAKNKASAPRPQIGKKRKPKHKAEDEAPESASRTETKASGSWHNREVRKEGGESGSSQKASSRKAPAKSPPSTAKAVTASSTVADGDTQPKRKRARLTEEQNEHDELELLAILAEKKKKAQAGVAKAKTKETEDTQKKAEPEKELVQGSELKQSTKMTPKPLDDVVMSDAPSESASPTSSDSLAQSSASPPASSGNASNHGQKAKAPKAKKPAPVAGMKGVATKVTRKRKSRSEKAYDDGIDRDPNEVHTKKKVIRSRFTK